jgi:secreted trypsin-like serine protease
LYACGGTIIGDYHILTAAHCVSQVSGYVLAPESMIIQLGAYNLDLLIGSSVQEHNVAKVTPHPEYDRYSHKNDVALVKLETKIKFTPYVQPACLYTRNDLDTFPSRGLTGSVIGWGRDEGGELSNLIKVANLPFVGFQECLDSNRDVFGQFLSLGMFCAGLRNGTNVCDGDSGGGIYISMNGAWYLVGVTAFTAQNNLRECSTEDYAVFMDISKYIGWIEGISGPLITEDDPSEAFVRPQPPQNSPVLPITQLNIPNLDSLFSAGPPSSTLNSNDFLKDFNSPENNRLFLQNARDTTNDYIRSGAFKDFFSPQNVRSFLDFSRQQTNDFYTSGASDQFWRSVG